MRRGRGRVCGGLLRCVLVEVVEAGLDVALLDGLYQQLLHLHHHTITHIHHGDKGVEAKGGVGIASMYLSGGISVCFLRVSVVSRLTS